MTIPAITVNRGESFKMPLKLTTKITLDHNTAAGDGVGDSAHLLIGELTGANARVNARFIKDLGGRRRTNAKNVGERRFDALLIWDLDSE